MPICLSDSRHNLREIANEISDICGSGRYHVLGDRGFALSINLLRPFPEAVVFTDDAKRLYNYRLSKVRMIIEQSFGFLNIGFRCLHTRLDSYEITSIILVTNACVHPHSWLIDQHDTTELRTDEDYIAMEERFPKPTS